MALTFSCKTTSFFSSFPESWDSQQTLITYVNSSIPHSKRTSPKSRFSSFSSLQMKHVKPSIKQTPTPSPPPPPATPPQARFVDVEPTSSYYAKRPNFLAKPQSWTPSSKVNSENETPKIVERGSNGNLSNSFSDLFLH